MFEVQQIDHVALTVSDVDKSVAWYGEVLGLRRRHEQAWGNVPAVMCAGETCVALFPASTATLHPAPDARVTAIMRHPAFRVDRENFERAQRALRERRIPFHFEDHEISRSIYFHDPDGYEIELTTYEPAT